MAKKHLTLYLFDLSYNLNQAVAEVDEPVLPAIFVAIILLYALDRIGRWFSVFVNQTELVSATVQFETTRIEMKKLFGQRYEGGQYVFVQFPELGWLHRWETHPFSISSRPGDETFTLHIKAMPGDTFTSELRQKVEAQAISTVRCSAPYGRLSINLKDYPIIALIAGGIGVTPMISIAQELAAMENKTFKKVFFIWAVRDAQAFDWFSEALSTLRSTPEFEVKLYASRAHQSENYISGRPEIESLYTMFEGEGDGDIGVAVCGPPQLVDDHSHESQKRNNLCGRQVHFHSETFIF